MSAVIQYVGGVPFSFSPEELAAVHARLDAVAANLAHAAPAFTRERRWERARAEVGILPTTTNQYDQQ